MGRVQLQKPFSDKVKDLIQMYFPNQMSTEPNNNYEIFLRFGERGPSYVIRTWPDQEKVKVTQKGLMRNLLGLSKGRWESIDSFEAWLQDQKHNMRESKFPKFKSYFLKEGADEDKMVKEDFGATAATISSILAILKIFAPGIKSMADLAQSDISNIELILDDIEKLKEQYGGNMRDVPDEEMGKILDYWDGELEAYAKKSAPKFMHKYAGRGNHPMPMKYRVKILKLGGYRTLRAQLPIMKLASKGVGAGAGWLADTDEEEIAQGTAKIADVATKVQKLAPQVKKLAAISR
jgi:hypothetical protein